MKVGNLFVRGGKFAKAENLLEVCRVLGLGGLGGFSLEEVWGLRWKTQFLRNLWGSCSLHKLRDFGFWIYLDFGGVVIFPVKIHESMRNII